MSELFITITDPELQQNYIKQYESDIKDIISSDIHPMQVVIDLARYLDIGYALITKTIKTYPEDRERPNICKYFMPFDDETTQLLCEQQFNSSFEWRDETYNIEVRYTIQPEKRAIIQEIMSILNEDHTYEERKTAVETYSQLIKEVFN